MNKQKVAKQVKEPIYVVVYLRLSKNPDGTLDSVDRQRRICGRFAKDRGIVVVEYFADDNLSAWKRGVRRPGWEKMLAALRAGEHKGKKLGGALSYHSDRLARNDHAAADFLAALEDRNLPLYTPEQGEIALGTSSDARFTWRVIIAVAIKSSEDTSRRIRDHKDDARLRGDLKAVVGGPPPLGFRYKAGTKEWEVDPVAREMFARVAEAIVARQPYHPICEEYGLKGSTVVDALKRPTTAGLMTDRDGKVIRDHTTGAVIDRDVWDRVRVKLSGRQRGRGAHEEYPYGPILLCSLCGNQLTGWMDYVTGRRQYACVNPHPKLGITKPCKGIFITAKHVEEWFGQAVHEWIVNYPGAAAALMRPVDCTTARAALEAELADNQASRARIEAQTATKEMTQEDYEQISPIITREFKRINAELSRLGDVETAAAEVPATLDWKRMDGPAKLAMMRRAFITPVDVLPGYWSTGERVAVHDRIPLEPIERKKRVA